MGNKTNRSAREELERIYGKHCMVHEGIRKLNPPKPKKCTYKGKSIAQQLTYHHLYPKHLGGKATVENGALVCRSCHDWLEQLTAQNKEVVNNELREYKAKAFNFEIGAIEFDTGGIRQAKKIQFEPIDDVIVIPAYDNELQQKIFEDNLDEIRWER